MTTELENIITSMGYKKMQLREYDTDTFYKRAKNPDHKLRLTGENEGLWILSFDVKSKEVLMASFHRICQIDCLYLSPSTIKKIIRDFQYINRLYQEGKLTLHELMYFSESRSVFAT